MNPAFVRIAAAGVLSAAALGAQTPVSSRQAAEFVGTIPCAEAVRSFIGGIEPGAPCHAVTWRLTLSEGSGGTGTWKLDAQYGVPPPWDPNQIVDGPKVTLKGILQASPRAYALTAGGRALTFAWISNDLLHLQTPAGALAVGTAGWSYTLSRRERAEQPADPATAASFSYEISPRSTGSTVFGVFEGRTPCRGIAGDLGLGDVPGCIKVKWRVTLYQDPQGAPSRYKVEGTLHRQHAREGPWRMTRGVSGHADAVVYELGAAGTEAPVMLLKGDDNVLFFLNQRRQLLVGSLDFGYTLNRVAPPAGSGN